MPTLADVILIGVLSPTLAMIPWLIIHFSFRRMVYVITTQRVLVSDSSGVIGEMRLSEISGFRGSRTSLLLSGNGPKLWLPRLPDAWQFETIIRKVSDKVSDKN